MKPFPLTPYPELIVNFCPTGMIPTKAMTPHVPISPEEVIEDSCRALDLGAAIVHLHAREEDGTPSYRGEIYDKMIRGIRSHSEDAIICVSCSGRNFPEFERRSEVLELTGQARPDLASLTMTSLDFPTGTSQNSPDMVIALAEKMVDHGIKPELECFDFGMINAAKFLMGKGMLGRGPWYFNLLLGSRYSVRQARPEPRPLRCKTAASCSSTNICSSRATGWNCASPRRCRPERPSSSTNRGKGRPASSER